VSLCVMTFATRVQTSLWCKTELHITAGGSYLSMQKPSGNHRTVPHLPFRMCAVKLKRIFEKYLFLPKQDRASATSGLSHGMVGLTRMGL